MFRLNSGEGNVAVILISLIYSELVFYLLNDINILKNCKPTLTLEIILQSIVPLKLNYKMLGKFRTDSSPLQKVQNRTSLSLCPFKTINWK